MARPFQRFRIINATPKRRVKGVATTNPASTRVVPDGAGASMNPSVPARSVRRDAYTTAVNNVDTVNVTVEVWSVTSGTWEKLLDDKSYSASMNMFIDEVVAHVRTDPNDDTEFVADVFVREGPVTASAEAEWRLADGDARTIDLRRRLTPPNAGTSAHKRAPRRASTSGGKGAPPRGKPRKGT